MSSLPYSALTPAQQAQAESIFHDALFGTDPGACTYGIDPGGLVQRERNPLVATTHTRKVTDVQVMKIGTLQLSPYTCAMFARLALETLSVPQEALPCLPSNLIGS